MRLVWNYRLDQVVRHIACSRKHRQAETARCLKTLVNGAFLKSCVHSCIAVIFPILLSCHAGSPNWFLLLFIVELDLPAVRPIHVMFISMFPCPVVVDLCTIDIEVSRPPAGLSRDMQQRSPFIGSCTPLSAILYSCCQECVVKGRLTHDWPP